MIEGMEVTTKGNQTARCFRSLCILSIDFYKSFNIISDVMWRNAYEETW